MDINIIAKQLKSGAQELYLWNLLLVLTLKYSVPSGVWRSRLARHISSTSVFGERIWCFLGFFYFNLPAVRLTAGNYAGGRLRGNFAGEDPDSYIITRTWLPFQ